MKNSKSVQGQKHPVPWNRLLTVPVSELSFVHAESTFISGASNTGYANFLSVN